jgi:hypothetical protein
VAQKLPASADVWSSRTEFYWMLPWMTVKLGLQTNGWLLSGVTLSRVATRPEPSVHGSRHTSKRIWLSAQAAFPLNTGGRGFVGKGPGKHVGETARGTSMVLCLSDSALSRLISSSRRYSRNHTSSIIACANTRDARAAKHMKLATITHPATLNPTGITGIPPLLLPDHPQAAASAPRVNAKEFMYHCHVLACYYHIRSQQKIPPQRDISSFIKVCPKRLIHELGDITFYRPDVPQEF